MVRVMRVGLTTSGLKARALPLSYTRLYSPFPHRGIRRVKDPSAPGRNSRASPADNAFCDEFCLHSLNKWDVMGNWHAMTDSNRRPPRSKRGALFAELMARGAWWVLQESNLHRAE